MRRAMFLAVGAAAAVYASALPPGTVAVDDGRAAAAPAEAALAEARARVERDPELRRALRAGAVEAQRDRLAAALEGSGLSVDQFVTAYLADQPGRPEP
jgi:hypothetical protein